MMNELYVYKKYENLKEEIYSYQHEMNINIFNNQVMVKVEQYIQSQAVKQTKAGYNSVGIREGSTLSVDHLISIILYTDYTNLSSYFSSTFRKQSPFDCLQTAKKRNSKVYWWSRRLKETVLCFGDYYPSLRGPFYSGMSMVLKITQFNIFLLSPTSTSLHIEVAMKFSGQQGIIIQINNDKVGNFTRGMDVSWISRYFEEEERYII